MSASEEILAAEVETKAKKKGPEYLTVKMEDGSEDTFSINAKSGQPKKLNKYYDLNDDGSLRQARFNFVNGRVLTTVPPASLLGRFAGHGLVQKYGDELAGLKPAEGQDEVDIDDMYLAMEELDEQIQKGLWSSRRESDGLGGTSILIKALMEYGGKPLEVVKAFLKEKDAKFKLALRLDNKKRNKDGKTMAEIVQSLEAAKASKGPKVDTESALEELDALEA